MQKYAQKLKVTSFVTTNLHYLKKTKVGHFSNLNRIQVEKYGLIWLTFTQTFLKHYALIYPSPNLWPLDKENAKYTQKLSFVKIYLYYVTEVGHFTFK